MYSPFYTHKYNPYWFSADATSLVFRTSVAFEVLSPVCVELAENVEVTDLEYFEVQRLAGHHIELLQLESQVFLRYPNDKPQPREALESQRLAETSGVRRSQHVKHFPAVQIPAHHHEGRMLAPRRWSIIIYKHK